MDNELTIKFVSKLRKKGPPKRLKGKSTEKATTKAPDSSKPAGHAYD